MALDGVSLTEIYNKAMEGADYDQTVLMRNLGPYSPTILENGLNLILQYFPYLETFECNTTSDWLNRTV